jgi:hypothetical protein
MGKVIFHPIISSIQKIALYETKAVSAFALIVLNKYPLTGKPSLRLISNEILPIHYFLSWGSRMLVVDIFINSLIFIEIVSVYYQRQHIGRLHRLACLQSVL